MIKKSETSEYNKAMQYEPVCAPSMGVVSKIQRDTKGCKSLAGKLVLVEILKQFEQQDYKKGGVSIDPSNYKAIAREVVKNCSIPDVVGSAIDSAKLIAIEKKVDKALDDL